MRHRAPTDAEALVREYGARIYRFCFRLCGHVEDAEDLAQDVLLLAWRGLEGFRGQAPFGAWLYRIALHRWRRLYGSGRPIPLPLSDDLDASPAPDPSSESLSRLSLESALTRLRAPHREAFILVKAEGFTYREAAQILEIPMGTVQFHVHEAMVRLRAILVDEDGETPSDIGIVSGMHVEADNEL